MRPLLLYLLIWVAISFATRIEDESDLKKKTVGGERSYMEEEKEILTISNKAAELEDKFKDLYAKLNAEQLLHSRIYERTSNISIDLLMYTNLNHDHGMIATIEQDLIMPVWKTELWTSSLEIRELGVKSLGVFIMISKDFALQHLWLFYNVGIFDADIHRPSLPTLINGLDLTVRRRAQDNTMIPIYYQGVKAMSFGWGKTGASGSDPHIGLSVMRGPILSQVVTQLLAFTDWGELDYLIIDMPPGTGDIQLSLSQQIKMDGLSAVVITTPQKLSFVDVVKGIQMFDQVKVPTLAIVENMSHFVRSDCGKAHYPFGKGFKDKITEQFGIKTKRKQIEPTLVDQEKNEIRRKLMKMIHHTEEVVPIPLNKKKKYLITSLLSEIGNLFHSKISLLF